MTLKRWFSKWTAGAAVAAAVTVVSGCAVVPSGNDEYREKIPAALNASGLGISDAGAGQSMSGVSITIEVWGTYAESAFPADDAPELFALILENNTRNASNINVWLETPDGGAVNMTAVKDKFGGGGYGDDRLFVTMDEARKIADQAG